MSVATEPHVERSGLIDLTDATLGVVNEQRDPVFVPFQKHLDAVAIDSVNVPKPHHIPVADHLSAIEVDDPARRRIIETLKVLRHDLAWGQTYSIEDFGAEFLQNYGWVYIVGPSAPVKSVDVLCAIMVLAPHTHYPLHRHQAEEIYLCLAGELSIRHGDQPWQSCQPGGFSHQAPSQPHALRTGEQPAVFLALWIGGDLAEKSEILERPSEI